MLYMIRVHGILFDHIMTMIMEYKAVFLTQKVREELYNQMGIFCSVNFAPSIYFSEKM